MMKYILMAVAIMPVLISAQTRVNSLRDGEFYVEQNSNFRGANAFEVGVRSSLLTNGRVSLAANAGYVLGVRSPWKSNSWTSGLSLDYRLDGNFSLYTRATTDFLGNYSQESGVGVSVYRTSNYSVGAHVGYVFDYPFKSDSAPKWVATVGVSFPFNSVFK